MVNTLNVKMTLRSVEQERPRKTFWDGVKENVKCFDLSQEDAQVRNERRNKIIGQATTPDLSGNGLTLSNGSLYNVVHELLLMAFDSNIYFTNMVAQNKYKWEK